MSQPPHKPNIPSISARQAAINAQREQHKAYAEELKDTLQKAKICLEHDSFKAYKESYEKTATLLFNAFLELPMNDPVTFAFEANAIRQRLIAIRSLGITITHAASLKIYESPSPAVPTHA